MIFSLVLYIFYTQISSISYQKLSRITPNNLYYLLLVIVLMPLNWGLDFLKWKLILKSNTKIESNVSFKSFLSGIAISAVTPNRIGNFLGRMIWFPNVQKTYLALSTLYSNLAQFIASLTLGCLGYAISKSLPKEIVLSSTNLLFLTFTIIIIILLYLFSFKIGSVLFKKYKNVFQNLRLHLKRYSFTFLAVSMLRFLIICLQYYFVLCIFQIEEITTVFPLVMTLFLFTTVTPSLFMGKLVIRESLALFIFSVIYPNEIVILTSSLLLWFTNLGIPAFAGACILWRLKLKK